MHGGGSCSSCVLSSQGGAGATETINLRWDDRFALNDDRTVYIEIRFFGGSTTGCGDWTLTVRGNTAVSSSTC